MLLTRAKPWKEITYLETAPAVHYELTNHLGNVLSVITPDANDATQPAIERLTDYYPFGMEEPGRSYSAEGYRYGFQGQDKEKELWGGEASFFKYRISDNRLGRFFSVDPLSSKFPWNSSYAFSENRVIDGVELEGAEYFDANDPNITSSQEDDNGGYNVTLGGYSFNGVQKISSNGNDYYKLDKHMYYGDEGWSTTYSGNNAKATIWLDTQLYKEGMEKIGWSYGSKDRVSKYVADLKAKMVDTPISYKKGNYCSYLAIEQQHAINPNANLNTGSKAKLTWVNMANVILTNSVSKEVMDDYINGQLDKGNPVIVGINHDSGKYAQHYITITGRVTENNNSYFTFMENAISGKDVANFDKNRLYFDSNGKLKGNTIWKNYKIDVVRIQKNK
ncbi:MAG: hypothetical protein MJZ34_13270 [Paludibacteraceae bacterium]|nr:hypothetical protein [Paludibacteraceae bacterium]